MVRWGKFRAPRAQPEPLLALKWAEPKPPLIRPAAELVIGAALIVGSFWQASDFLNVPEFADEARQAQPNTLTFSHNDLLGGADVTQVLTPDSETITIELDGVATFSAPEGRISYETHGFGNGSSWSCTQTPGDETVTVNENDEPSRLWLTEEDDANEIVCRRDAGFEVRDRQGEVYLFPTEFILVSDLGTPTQPVVYQFDREVRVPEAWSYENRQTTIAWSAYRNSTFRGTEGSILNSEEQSFGSTGAASDQVAPMRFTDGNAEEAAERSAWVAALLAGLGASLGMNGLLHLPGAVRARLRARVSR